MFLHKDDKELFHDVIITVSDRMGVAIDIVEKDYYVTMILNELTKRSDKVVFKGGTSISKAYKAIDRFSEDVDITFTEHIGSARRKKLKYQVLQPISEILDMPVSNWDRKQKTNHYYINKEDLQNFLHRNGVLFFVVFITVNHRIMISRERMKVNMQYN